MKKLFPVFVLCFFLTSVSAFGQMLDRSDSRVQTTFSPGAGWQVLGTVRPKSVTEITAGQNWTLGCETLDRDYIFWDTYKEYDKTLKTLIFPAYQTIPIIRPPYFAPTWIILGR